MSEAKLGMFDLLCLRPSVEIEDKTKFDKAGHNSIKEHYLCIITSHAHFPCDVGPL